MTTNQKPSILAYIKGIIALTLVVLWLIILFSMFFPISLLKILIPVRPIQHLVTNILLGYVWLWIGFVNLMGKWVSGIEFDVQGLDDIDKKGRYFIIANHSAWTDIIILFHLYHGRMPFPRWFMKRELIWIPMIGYVCWAVDMPFMYRVTADRIKKNPKLKGKDMEITRRKCEKFRDRPIVVTNYLEGTRFSREKHSRQKSPYKHLLMPKYGGAAFALNAIGEQLDGIIDMTVVFSPGVDPSGMNYILGRVRKVVVRARILPVPMHILSRNLQEDQQAREEFRAWVNEIWDHKDRQIDQIRREMREEFGVEYHDTQTSTRAEA